VTGDYDDCGDDDDDNNNNNKYLSLHIRKQKNNSLTLRYFNCQVL
jgi:hypothetical protein